MIFVTGRRCLNGYDQFKSRMITKETYFTFDNIREESQAMLAQLQPGLRPRSAAFIPEHSALLVLDMQRYFLDLHSHACIPSAPAILPGIQQLIHAYAQSGLPIIFSRHLNTTEDAGNMASWWRDLISGDRPESMLTPELDTSSGTILHKSQYDAFMKTDLEADLRARWVRSVVISGVMTHLCCESTARSAFMRGFEVFFLVDATATYNRAFHLASQLNLAHGFASLQRTTDILAALGAEVCSERF